MQRIIFTLIVGIIGGYIGIKLKIPAGAMIGSMMVVTGLWKKPGVFNLEEMDPDPYMEALNKFGLPWKVVENPVSVDCYKTADPSVHMD